MLNSTTQILRRLRTAAMGWRRREWGVWCFQTSAFCWLGLVILGLGDAVFHWSGAARATGFGLLAFALTLRLIWFWYRRKGEGDGLESIARFLETQDPTLGSKLMNFLQLRAQGTDPKLSPLTRTLADQAVEQCASGIADKDFQRLVRTPRLRQQATRAAIILGGFVLLLGLGYEVTRMEIPRFLDPFGDHPPYSFTRIEILQPGPSGTNILYGGSLLIQAKVMGHVPRELFVTSVPTNSGEAPVTLPMFQKANGRFDQQLLDLRRVQNVYVHTKDRRSLSKLIPIGLIWTPQWEKAFVQSTPPAYTRLPAEERSYALKPLQVLEGTVLRFRIGSNRPLREGTIEFTPVEGVPQTVALKPAMAGDREVVGTWMAKDSGRFQFRMMDVDGHSSTETWEGALTVTHDLAPTVEIVEPAQDSFVAMDFHFDARITATDDYGLQWTRVHVGLNQSFRTPEQKTYTNLVRHVQEVVTLSPQALGAKPGDLISVFAEAADTAPESHTARSRTLHMVVISVEQYNQFLREQLDMKDIQAKYAQLFDQVQGLVEEQKKLTESVDALKKDLQKTPNGEADRKQRERQLDQLLARQSELNQKLNDQAERMEQFVRKDPVYDVESDFQQTLKDLASRIRNSTQTNDMASRKVASESSPAQGPRRVDSEMLDSLRKASEAQVQALSGMANNGKEMADTMEDMEALQEVMKDFNEFEALFEAQESIAEQMKAYSHSGPLRREDQLALKSLAKTQHEVSEMLEMLPHKLRRDADQAKAQFPKAAKSARELAIQLEEHRFASQARNASDRMLAAESQVAAVAAEQLRAEMERLLRECNSEGNCPNPQELDQYLQATRGRKAGRSFSQMAQTKKFQKPGSAGQGKGSGSEKGSAGGGYAMQDHPEMSVLGNETMANPSESTQLSYRKSGAAAAAGQSSSASASVDKADSLRRLKSINRNSGAIPSETLVEEYSDVVDQYFKTLSK